MHPVLFTIPDLPFVDLPFLPFPVRAFGLMLAVGFLVGVHLAGRIARRYGDDPEGDPERLSRVGVAVLIGIVLGARLFYVIVEQARHWADSGGKDFLGDPASILAVWEGGMVMYGGLFGAVLFGCRSALKQGMRPLAALDVGLTGGMVGQSIGRWGCLLVGDDYGRVIQSESLRELPFPITLRVPEEIPEHSLFEPHLAGEVLWGTQVWMSLNALVIAGIAYWLLGRRRYPGHTTLWIVFLYAITRFVIEGFRGDALRGVWFAGLSTSQLISIVAAGVAGYLLWRDRHRREPMPGVPAAADPPAGPPEVARP